MQAVWKAGDFAAPSSTWREPARESHPGEGLFTRACSDRQGGDGFKVQENRFSSGIGKEILSVRVVGHWHRLSWEACPGCSIPERPGWVRLWGTWSSASCSWLWQGLEQGDPWVPSNPSHSDSNSYCMFVCTSMVVLVPYIGRPLKTAEKLSNPIFLSKSIKVFKGRMISCNM